MHPEIQDFLNKGVGPTIHWFPSSVPVSKLASILIGMANADGGTVIIGISPRSGHVLGIEEPKKSVDLVFQASLLSDPPLVLPLPQELMIGGKKIVKVVIPKGLPYVYNLDGRYLYRVGSQTRPLPSRKLRRLLMERGVIQFESRVPTLATLEDLNPNLIVNYMAALSYPGNEPYEVVLRRRGCITLDDGVLRPTYAGLLLFGKNPQQWLPSSQILAARFPRNEFSDEFLKQEIIGTLPEQIRQAEVFIRNNLRSIVRMVGLTRKDTLEYPLEAVRELLVNAVAHRDYNLQGDGIHIHIFANRFEIHSPGGLPGPVNLDNLFEARFSRNAVISQVLSDLGFVERLGYGLNRVLTALKKNDLPNPVFKEIGGSFRVILQNTVRDTHQEIEPRDYSQYMKSDLNPRQGTALTHLGRHGRITNRVYQELCPGVSSETLRRDLVDLVRKGILIKIGDKKSTYYILK
jgi:ATP-dependent DNA helicase RecG